MTHSRMYRTWMERISGAEIAESHIRQFCHNIAPANWCEMRGGHHSSLTDDECILLVQDLTERVNNVDGGPRVTEEQAEKGRTWLEREWGHLELPGGRTRAHDIKFFKFQGAHKATDSRYRNLFVPIYLAYFHGGASLLYTAVPWQAGRWDGKVDYTRLLEWREPAHA